MCVIPYAKDFANKISNVLCDSEIKTAYKYNNKLHQFIKPKKDPLQNIQKNNVVYKIECSDCKATYIGQTKRQLGTRIKEHKQNINKKSDSQTIITEHIVNNNHRMDWNNTKIIDTETNYNRRLISECIHIKRHT